MSADPIDLLVLGGLVVTMDDNWSIHRDAGIAIRGADIVEVGSSSDLEQRYLDSAGRTMQLDGQLVMPGLINPPTPGAESLFRGLIDDLPLEPWIDRLWAVEKKILNPETVGAGARLAYSEMIRGRTTTALDMSWYPETSAEAALEIGFRVITGPVWFD